MIEKLYLIARIADTRVAFRSSAIDSVVVVGDVVPVFGAPPHIAGLFALRSRVLTLIDPKIVIGAATVPIAPRQRVIVIDVGGHGYALMADAIEDVCFVEGDEHPLRGRLTDGWGRIADAMIEHDGATLVVVEPERLVSVPMLRAA
jgi:purine-binding chemotaxis protein CheW